MCLQLMGVSLVVIDGCGCACSEVVPEYDHAIFKMTNFRELQRKGKEIYSESLKLQGLVWRLKVYPVSGTNRYSECII